MADVALSRMHALLSSAEAIRGRPPRIVLVAQDILISIYVSSEGATNPGTVTVVEYGARDFQRFGFILPDGTWDPDRKWNDGDVDVLTPIREFTADPTSVASSQGAKTGKCAFCGGTNRGEPLYFHVACARRFGLEDLRPA